MGKKADKYFGVDPWRIEETGFDKGYSAVAESVFSLGNEHMGVRGYFDEGYSGEGLQGCYVNGLYERRPTNRSHYKGMLTDAEFMINTVDWLYTRIECNGRRLDLNVSDFSDFSRNLDMRTGELTRTFVWHVDTYTDVRFTFNRLLSMKRLSIGASSVEWEVLRGSAELSIAAGLDFTRLHVSSNANFWDCDGEFADGSYCCVNGVTKNTRQTLFAAVMFDREGNPSVGDGLTSVRFSDNKNGKLTRIASLSKTAAHNVRDSLRELNYHGLLAENRHWWTNQWKLSDIVIEGDGESVAEDQQGIRYCVFQMHQTVHSGEGRVIIGAKGLTGEAYSGNTFWDTEVYCLPFYLFTNPIAANGILQFRHETLNEAKKRANELDCDGAFYPIATISGSECCDLWQHANTQLQASTAVAYGLWHHARVTGDDSFLTTKGLPVIVEICRMLASRGGFDPVTGEYGYYGVMGPDEFQLFVNHNRYTNFMAKKVLSFTLETVAKLKERDINEYHRLSLDLLLKNDELIDWQTKADKMRVGCDEKSLLFEQHDGYFHLPHVDLRGIPVTDFPLYSHWAYDRIYRNDLIKQPDVLMFMFMYADDFSREQLAANFDFYEPRCIHESSLSPSVHSVLACRLGRAEQAYGFFKFASRLDLDNYNRNTAEGLHTTSIAGSWINITYGFGGVRSDADLLSISPILPDEWRKLSFRLLYRGRVLSIIVENNSVTVTVEDGNPLTIKLCGNETLVDGDGVTATLTK